jgi:hypothetical protein
VRQGQERTRTARRILRRIARGSTVTAIDPSSSRHVRRAAVSSNFH